jgi:hypothetical protein
MRIHLSPAGLIDDMAGEVTAVHISRTGTSRYRVDIRAASPIRLEVWTTHNDRVAVSAWENQPHWIALNVGPDGELESLSASNCHFHLEHLDSNAYFLGISRGDERWGLTLQASGYIKTRVMSDDRSQPSPPRT